MESLRPLIRESFRESAINLYPVPAQGILTINSSVVIERMEVYDLRGRFVAKQVLNTMQGTLDLSTAKAGVYLIYLIRDNQTVVKRLIIE